MAPHSKTQPQLKPASLAPLGHPSSSPSPSSPSSPPPPPPSDQAFTREALRLHHRYQTEIVEAFGLCPWAEKSARDGHTRERVCLESDGAAVTESLAAIDTWMVDAGAEVAFVIYPRIRTTRQGFHEFTARLRDADTPRHPLGEVPFVFAAFFPEAPPDTSDAERLIPFLRRTPDPTIQLLRASVLDSIRNGASQGTQFVNMANLDMALAGTGQPPLRERIARTNLATAERAGVAVISKIMDDIRRDRDETYQALSAARDASTDPAAAVHGMANA
jgi:hypothetical protein